MKLVSLNTWGGKLFQPLMAFITEQSKDTDVFCLQEVFSTDSGKTDYRNEEHDIDARLNLYQEIEKRLPGYVGYYAPAYKGFIHGVAIDFDIGFGLATFVRKDLRPRHDGDI